MCDDDPIIIAQSTIRLCQENAHLSAQVSAQDSIVCGLREERKLWGHELALQGASLAQETWPNGGQDRVSDS